MWSLMDCTIAHINSLAHSSIFKFNEGDMVRFAGETYYVIEQIWFATSNVICYNLENTRTHEVERVNEIWLERI